MDRSLFFAQALDVAPQLLGAKLTLFEGSGDENQNRPVTLRITEVEAYHGVGTTGPYDAGSHARDRKTDRNASMFGPPGHAYVYFSYGMHFAINMVCSPEGTASGVLIRAGQVTEGADLARLRRESGRSSKSIASQQLARGPGNVASALGITRPKHDGADLFAMPFKLQAPDAAPERIDTGPRVGVSGVAGSNVFPWRFWIAGDPTVSQYRPGKNVPK